MSVKTYVCPTCKGPVTKGAGRDKLFPFCSERCHLVDLGRWLGEEYRIPGEPAESAMGLGADAWGADARGADDDAK